MVEAGAAFMTRITVLTGRKLHIYPVLLMCTPAYLRDPGALSVTFVAPYGVLRKFLFRPQHAIYGMPGAMQFLLCTARDRHPARMKNALPLAGADGPLAEMTKAPIRAEFPQVHIPRLSRPTITRGLLPGDAQLIPWSLAPRLAIPIAVASLVFSLVPSVLSIRVVALLASRMVMLLMFPRAMASMALLAPATPPLMITLRLSPPVRPRDRHAPTVLRLHVSATAFPRTLGPIRTYPVTLLVGSANAPFPEPLTISDDASCPPVLPVVSAVALMATGTVMLEHTMSSPRVLLGREIVPPMVVTMLDGLVLPFLPFLAMTNPPEPVLQSTPEVIV